MPVEYLIRNSDNQIKLTLTEDDIAITGAWTSLDIFIDGTLVINRIGDGNGVTFDTTTGLLTLTPGDFTAPEKAILATFAAEEYHDTQIVVTTALNDDGAVFAGAGSDLLLFYISDKPS